MPTEKLENHRIPTKLDKKENKQTINKVYLLYWVNYLTLLEKDAAHKLIAKGKHIEYQKYTSRSANIRSIKN